MKIANKQAGSFAPLEISFPAQYNAQELNLIDGLHQTRNSYKGIGYSKVEKLNNDP